jgi:hypothetical protein
MYKSTNRFMQRYVRRPWADRAKSAPITPAEKRAAQIVWRARYTQARKRRLRFLSLTLKNSNDL